MLGKLFARALQLHPRNSGLWIKAASWEFFDASNSSSARSLMQRGLRINPGAKNLWLQYFRLEFCYVEKVTGRRKVLGLDDPDGDSGDKGTGDRDAQNEGGMIIPALEGEGDGEQSGAPSFKGVKKATAAVAAPVMNDTARKFYRGAVPLAVFRAAIKAVPLDVGFRGEFLRCCAEDFPGLSDEVATAILSSIADDFPESCEAWELRALYPLLLVEGQGNGSINKGGALAVAILECVEIFELAVQAVGSREPGMWVRYAAFLRDRLGALQDRRQRKKTRENPATASDLMLRMYGVLKRAVKNHVNTDAVPAVTVEGRVDNTECRMEDAREALSSGLADVCIALGKPEEALEVLRDATGCLPSRSALWLRRAALERRLDSLKRFDMVDVSSTAPSGESDLIPPPAKRFKKSGVMDAGGGDAAKTLREGLKSVSPKARGYPDLWRELISSLVATRAGKKQVAAAFRQAVTACDPSGTDPGNAQGEFIEGYVRWSGAMEGLEAARAALDWARRSFLLAGTGAVGVYKQAIELEKVLGSRETEAVNVEGKKRVRELYEVCTLFSLCNLGSFQPLQIHCLLVFSQPLLYLIAGLKKFHPQKSVSSESFRFWL